MTHSEITRLNTGDKINFRCEKIDNKTRENSLSISFESSHPMEVPVWCKIDRVKHC